MECEHFNKELTAALTNSECEQTLESVEGTPSASASKNSTFLKFCKRSENVSDRELLKSVIMIAKSSVRPSSHLFFSFITAQAMSTLFSLRCARGAGIDIQLLVAGLPIKLQKSLKSFATGVEDVPVHPDLKPFVAVR